jgi:hypothetical protein
MERFATLSIVGNTAAYSLADDFLYLVRLDVPIQTAGVLHTANGLVPLSTDYDERYSITGRTITFTPTPQYTLTRNYWYAAGHELDNSSAYPYLLDEDVQILILKAQALALRIQALSLVTSGTGEIVEYAIGDERVKKGSPSSMLSTQADALEQQYLQAVSQAVGPGGRRARYDSVGNLR